MAGGEPAIYRLPAIGRFAAWAMGILGLTVATLLVGVGLAVAVSGQVDTEQWNRLSDVGQTFGALSALISGLALGVVVVSARMQFRDMRQGRIELQRQMELLARNQSELHRAAELSHLDLLIKLMKMSIDDPVLAEVWPEYGPDLPEERNRQYLYANIIYQFNQASAQMNEYTEEQVLENIRYLFTSPLMRDYWAAATRARKALQPGSREYEFSQKVDALCREYDNVAASAKRVKLQSTSAVSNSAPPRWPGDADDRPAVA
ncbi:DUF6082 family protein [Actinoplanes regularis]|uniref:DUF6082 family protein n=1 Tax=Actinoplanes regularis TaxID=52697 RepID=UPI0024A36674|nr:DUF6082 family protein [Actinoplanes regularis]GLW28174.1 hypothetical protein Areg01_11140 [Actinoplanes regularis]